VRKFSLVAQGAAPVQRLGQFSPAPIHTGSRIHFGNSALAINAYAKRREGDYLKRRFPTSFRRLPCLI
jgi:hypothetical protein